jgi:hypothetical protein
MSSGWHPFQAASVDRGHPLFELHLLAVDWGVPGCEAKWFHDVFLLRIE